MYVKIYNKKILNNEHIEYRLTGFVLVKHIVSVYFFQIDANSAEFYA